MLKTLAGILICGSCGIRSAMYYEIFSNTTTREFIPNGIRPFQSVSKSVGSCIASVSCQVTDAPPSDQMGRDSFGIDHRFIRRHIEMQVLLVDPAEGTQIGAERRSCPFTGVAMNLASAVAIVITGPLADTMAHRGMGRMAAVIALPLISVQPCTASWKALDEEPVTSPPVRMVAHPKTLLVCLTRHDTDDRGAIVGVGTMAFALIGASAGRVGWVAMGRAVFPPRSDTTRPPHRRCPP